ncbi:tRNA (adenosine(37)-N6)-threonylcarbamoyltransferase complex ATPase subunit type 1 TsaE [Sulfitobacter sp. F26204]|uniref:tRNA (adenosine(37)-N6)-threonylcarbamoyltransferase complex ATPase subunit type 1 TsaE n=1 Tax=Sulfitobacter sp. F26204 TaxID=2996014 RepID=UPI00225DF331|nr:tRNA (adenosine(37)-N6)-threonylcarbamoyltransferase complex ATPase subunit type 1 TsaE [Sulfitobacter sp. F26204]MCX7558228.1 tRNA (adenosine(37)-N6)-threonylcarbamoyltransferase complex ATPase subunit type 1 TsaE [Sulfitobacter sp. F26204]
MNTQSRTITSASPEETAALAVTLASVLNEGDVILLQGDVGAGKTHFARALIQSMLDTSEDIPSPTFTLVQTYPAGPCDIWHADLYRLTSVQEIEELGLVAAFETDICLVEWPDRLGPLIPQNALHLALERVHVDEARKLSATWTDPKWDDRMKVWGS